MEDQDNNTQRIEVSGIDAQWAEIFRYQSVYPGQKKGIERFLDTLKQNGFYSLEGPCGTGKTLIGVTAAMHAMRSGAYPEYTETCVLTPNKQQLKQFVTEMRGVNSSLPSNKTPANTVVMKGRQDMLPYSFVDIHPFNDGSFNQTVDSLKRNTRKIIQFGSDIPIDWPDDMNPPESALYDFDWDTATENQRDRRNETAYDPIRAEAVRQIVERLVDSNPDYKHLTVDGVESPYPDKVPHTREIVDEEQLQSDGKSQLPIDMQVLFDPFYAGFCAEGEPGFGFREADNRVFDREILFSQCVKRGICPHETMAHFGKKAEFVLGNYMHLFDPLTRNLTVDKMGLFSETTIAILDEAHRIEEKVRDMLSETLDIYTIDKTIADLEYTEAYMSSTFSKTPTPTPNADEIEAIHEAIEEARTTPDTKQITEEDITESIELFEFLKQKLVEMSADYLQSELDSSWRELVENGSVQDEEYALTSPEFPNTEGKLLRKVTARFENGAERMKNALPIMECVNEFFEQLDDKGIHTREPQEKIVGEFCQNWVEKDSIDYHREIVLTKSLKENIKSDYPHWVKGWTPKFQLFNCIPTNELQTTFESLGAGLLMSATLSPPEAFEEAVGVNNVSKEPIENEQNTSDNNSQETDKSTSGDNQTRSSKSDQLPLRFPEQNRDSIIVDLPKFTSGNRGARRLDRNEMNSIRNRYADSIVEVANTHGNVLICMPKYSEAKWAFDSLRDEIRKQCYLDQSSTDKETNKKLDKFFHSDHGVMFTSLRGTITEGIDYDGDKLHCCATIGVPLIDTRPKRIEAIEHAYANRISTDNGFNTAIKIPAIRKTRQAIGRVLRGVDEVGVRVLIDERYGSTEWDGAKQFLSPQEQREFDVINAGEIECRISSFWSDR